MTETPMDPVTRIHERLDSLFERQGQIAEDVATIKANCGPCRASVSKHESTLYGNGQPGLVTRLTAAEVGRTDTLTIKGVVTMLGAVGALAATIGAAMGAMMK